MFAIWSKTGGAIKQVGIATMRLKFARRFVTAGCLLTCATGVNGRRALRPPGKVGFYAVGPGGALTFHKRAAQAGNGNG